VPTIQKETSVAAGAVNDNLLSGSAFEYMRSNGIVSAAVVAAATGTFVTIQSGPDIVLEESAPMVLTTMPIIPDHMYFSGIGLQTEQIIMRVRNTTGGNLTVRSICQLTDA